MDYKEALKQVQATKHKEGYLHFCFGYDAEFLLPFKAGQELLASLGHAEHFKAPYNAPPQISAVAAEDVKIHMVSVKEYERLKIAQLLGVTVDEAIKAEKQAAASPPIS